MSTEGVSKGSTDNLLAQPIIPDVKKADVIGGQKQDDAVVETQHTEAKKIKKRKKSFQGYVIEEVEEAPSEIQIQYSALEQAEKGARERKRKAKIVDKMKIGFERMSAQSLEVNESVKSPEISEVNPVDTKAVIKERIIKKKQKAAENEAKADVLENESNAQVQSEIDETPRKPEKVLVTDESNKVGRRGTPQRVAASLVPTLIGLQRNRSPHKRVAELREQSPVPRRGRSPTKRVRDAPNSTRESTPESVKDDESGSSKMGTETKTDTRSSTPDTWKSAILCKRLSSSEDDEVILNFQGGKNAEHTPFMNSDELETSLTSLPQLSPYRPSPSKSVESRPRGRKPKVKPRKETETKSIATPLRKSIPTGYKESPEMPILTKMIDTPKAKSCKSLAINNFEESNKPEKGEAVQEPEVEETAIENSGKLTHTLSKGLKIKRRAGVKFGGKKRRGGWPKGRPRLLQRKNKPKEESLSGLESEDLENGSKQDVSDNNAAVEAKTNVVDNIDSNGTNIDTEQSSVNVSVNHTNEESVKPTKHGKRKKKKKKFRMNVKDTEETTVPNEVDVFSNNSHKSVMKPKKRKVPQATENSCPSPQPRRASRTAKTMAKLTISLAEEDYLTDLLEQTSTLQPVEKKKPVKHENGKKLKFKPEKIAKLSKKMKTTQTTESKLQTPFDFSHRRSTN